MSFLLPRRLLRAGALVALVLAPLAGNAAITAAPATQATTPAARVPDPREPGVQYFAATGHTLRATFLAYWERYGGLAQFGYPITEEFPESNGPRDTPPLTVQYFERARFELHPENAGTAHEVLLGALGVQFHAPDPAVPALANPTSVYFEATGHNLSGVFRAYWEQHGGLFVNGYPISEQFEEVNPIDGKPYTVQYFERSRFEYHPENAGTSYEVLLGLLGTQMAEKMGYFGPDTGATMYPRYGRAGDSSWLAGQVILSRIQGGCMFVQYDGADGNALVVPSGDAWTAAQQGGQAVAGAYVVLFGHPAHPGDPVELCAGAPGYVVERIEMNNRVPLDR
jgi:hypothetical protein